MQFYSQIEIDAFDEVEDPGYSGTPKRNGRKLSKLSDKMGLHFAKRHLKSYLKGHPEFGMSADEVEALLNAVREPGYFNQRQRENMVDAALNLLSDMAASEMRDQFAELAHDTMANQVPQPTRAEQSQTQHHRPDQDQGRGL